MGKKQKGIVFAGMDVGSYEVHMCIYEVGNDGSIKLIDEMRRPVDLGTSSFDTGKIDGEAVDDLCDILNDLKKTMELYKVEDYTVYATSAIRETRNTWTLLDQIKQRTGFELTILSNSEQRFLNYKAVALTDMSSGKNIEESTFNTILAENTAILDIGGGSIQLSVFENGKLISTQNLKLGVLRIKSYVGMMDAQINDVEMLVDELLETQFSTFKKLFIKEKSIGNIIMVDDYLSPVLRRGVTGILEPTSYLNREKLDNALNGLRFKSAYESAEEYDVSTSHALLMYYSAILLKHALQTFGAQNVWMPGVCLCDGIVYEYAEKKGLFKEFHDFEKDIVACARRISKRYMGNTKRGRTIEKIALGIFDCISGIHGLTDRERLLLRVSAMLHDCGKYINQSIQGDCSYQIIMATEIIGLSHREREIVANVVMYNHKPFEYNGGYLDYGISEAFDRNDYLIISKMTAILKLATALDRSHKGKFNDLELELEEEALTIMVDKSKNITVEKGLLESRAEFFKEIFNIMPVIKAKQIV